MCNVHLLLLSGYLVMGDTFTSTLFQQTFQKLFTKDSQNANFRMSFNASFEIKVCRSCIHILRCIKNSYCVELLHGSEQNHVHIVSLLCESNNVEAKELWQRLKL